MTIRNPTQVLWEPFQALDLAYMISSGTCKSGAQTFILALTTNFYSTIHQPMIQLDLQLVLTESFAEGPGGIDRPIAASLAGFSLKRILSIYPLIGLDSGLFAAACSS